MKKFCLFLLVSLVCFIFIGCINTKDKEKESIRSITDITKTKEETGVHHYTVTFSDGTTYDFTVKASDGATPYIGENGNWWINGVDTGAKSKGEDGVIPHIGENGNWWLGNIDTLVKAAGDDGVTPHIGENGNWWIGETDTLIKAAGDDGVTPHIGENGNWWIGETDTLIKAAGDEGDDGLTPHIGENGNWWIGETDTLIKATGENGLTPHIGENGNWWIGETDTLIKATGDEGEDGKSAYEIYLEHYPDYQGDETQWLDDLINGRLGQKGLTFPTTNISNVRTNNNVVLFDFEILDDGDYYLDCKVNILYKDKIVYDVSKGANLQIGMNKDVRFEKINTDSDYKIQAMATYYLYGFIKVEKVINEYEFKSQAYAQEPKLTISNIKISSHGIDFDYVIDNKYAYIKGINISIKEGDDLVAYKNIYDIPTKDTLSLNNLIQKTNYTLFVSVYYEDYNNKLHTTKEYELAFETEESQLESIEINGKKTLYIGYPVQYDVSVYPIDCDTNVIWESENPNIATVDEFGVVTPIAIGTTKIIATSFSDSSISNFIEVIVKEKYPNGIVDLEGYKIVIMQADSALGEIDPFRTDYTAIDKVYKQEAWRQVETDFNCKIVVQSYPSSAPWGETRITWIINNATDNNAKFDLGFVPSNWIYRLSQANAAADVTDYYNEFGMGQMEPAVKEAGSYKGKLHIASTGTSPTATYVTLGLYYNIGMLNKYGIEDPAQIFNEGGWTYSGFENWVNQANSVIGYNEYVLGGHSYYYWFGMTNAAGIRVADVTNVNINISNQNSKDASALMRKLVQTGAVDTTLTWQETWGSFIDGNTLMTTGYYWFIRNDTRWKKNLWGEGITSYGYVPFPYPDGMAKEDTRIAIDTMSCYLYSSGRPYPEGVDLEGIYLAVNKMFLDTIKRQNEDPNFNVTQKKMAVLSNKLDSSHSVTAAMYYTADKVFFDPAHAIYPHTSATPLNSVSQRVLFQGANYDQEFDAVYQQLYDKLIDVYG